MKPTVYIETSVISCLTSRPSRDLVVAAWQQVTQEWWEQQAPAFNLVTSDLVEREASRGDVESAAKRISVIEELRILQTKDAAFELAERLVHDGTLPPKAARMAFTSP